MKRRYDRIDRGLRRLAVASITAILVATACNSHSGTLPPAIDISQVIKGPPRAGRAHGNRQVWKTLGPYESTDSGKLNAIVVDPKNSNTMYVAGGAGHNYEVITSAGIYRSTNAGRTWQSADVGLGDLAVNDLWIDARQPNVLLAATEGAGIYRTTTAGTSWKSVAPHLLAKQFAQIGGVIYAATADGVLRSKDAGRTWAVAYSSTVPVNAIAALGKFVIAGCTDGTIAGTSGGGWILSGKIPNPQGDAGIHALAIDPESPSTIYASRNSYFVGALNVGATQDLWVSKNGGVTWHQVFIPAAVQTAIRGSQVMAFSAVTPHLLYVGGIRQYAYDGRTWTPEGFFGDERSIAVTSAKRGGEDIWVGSDQGAWHTTDIGDLSPHSLTLGLSINVVPSVAVNSEVIATTIQDFTPAILPSSGSWAFPSPQSFFEDGDVALPRAGMCLIDDLSGYSVSRNNCQSFARDTSLQAPGFLSNDNLEIDSKKPSIVYMATQQGVYRSTDSGASMRPTRWPLTAPEVIRVDPRNDANIFVIGNNAGTVYVSHNGGRSWMQADGFPGYYIQGLAVDPADSKIVVAGLEAYQGAAIYRSSNGGNSFSYVTTPISSSARFRNPAAFSALRQRRLPRGFDAAVYLFPAVNGLSFDPSPMRGTMPSLVLSTTRGIAVSKDLGSTWRNIAGNALTGNFQGIAWANGRIYVATYGEGVIVSSAP